MGTKLRKKMFPGEKNIASNAINKEAKKIIEKILMFTDVKGLSADLNIILIGVPRSSKSSSTNFQDTFVRF